MSIDLTRRLFVFGSAAAVGAVTVPRFTPVERVAALTHFSKRHIASIAAINAADAAMALKLIRDGTVLHETGVAPHGHYVWRPYYYCEYPGLWIFPGQTFNLECVGGSLAGVDLICDDWLGDDNTPIAIVERHEFPRRGPARMLPLNLDDAERLEQHRRRHLI